MFQTVSVGSKFIRMNAQNVLQLLLMRKVSMSASNALLATAMKFTLYFIIKKAIILLFLTSKKFQKKNLNKFKLQNLLQENREALIQILTTFTMKSMYFVLNAILNWTIRNQRFHQWSTQFYWLSPLMNNQLFQSGNLSYNHVSIHFCLIKLGLRKQQKKDLLIVRNVI